MTINDLYIPILNESTSLNGLIALFINRWSGSKTQLIFVDFPCDTPVFRVEAASKETQSFDSFTTTLPFLVLHKTAHLSQLTVSGLAAVCRHVIKISDDPEVQKALGFRENCLQAPAEVSIWTCFCEVEMPESTRMFLQTEVIGDVVELPTPLVQFEEHLKQPIRMHNVVKRYQQEQQPSGNHQQDSKQVQKLAASLLDHTFAEGRDMTLADLLLYPCVRIIADRLYVLGIDLTQHLPRVSRWLLAMETLVGKAWSDTFPRPDFDISSLRIRPAPAVKVPRVEETSLYKKDANRPRVGSLGAEEASRVTSMMQDQRLWLDDSADIPAGLVSHLDISPCSEFTAIIDWSSLPDPAHPQQGHVPGSRLDRKIQQLDGMISPVINSVSEGDVIVDFCSGGGHLGIVLAHLLPRCVIILVDNKEESTRKARLRVANLNVPNVQLVQSNLDYFRGRFDLGVALHACGVATDLVLQTCLQNRAAFVLCPCCYGNLALPDLPIQYPQSQLYKKRGVLAVDHSVLARLADNITPAGANLAMAAVDLDRVARASENGYRVTLSKLKPDSCSPKHDLLVGIPVKD